MKTLFACLALGDPEDLFRDAVEMGRSGLRKCAGVERSGGRACCGIAFFQEAFNA